MNQNPLQLIKCKRWYCKNTISAYGVNHTGGYCERCDKARKTLGWFFQVQPIIRLLSFPFLFIGGCGLGLEIARFLSSGPEKEALYENPLSWIFAIALAGGLFGFGWLLRWISEIDSFSRPTKKAEEISKIGADELRQLEIQPPELIKPELTQSEIPTPELRTQPEESITQSNKVWRNGRFITLRNDDEISSLVKCTVCGHEISSLTEICPYCYTPITRSE